MQNYKMIIGYDGRRYKGFRKTSDGDDKTIQGKLEKILFKLYDTEIEVVSAVNTDAGVHAKKQVIHFKAPNANVDELTIFNYFEEYLPDDIIVISVEVVDERFHSRYMVKSVTYQYRLWKKDSKTRPLFERHYVKVMEKPLDISAMQEATTYFLGEHDFVNFSTKSKINNSIKNIIALDIAETNNEIIIRITANGFLLNMERIIVGTLIQIGLHQREIDTIEQAYKTRKKDAVGHKAMGYALCLVDVEY